jgi:hypothetical protein
MTTSDKLSKLPRVIHIADIMKIHSCGRTTASKRMKLFKQALNKAPEKSYFVHEYLAYAGLETKKDV